MIPRTAFVIMFPHRQLNNLFDNFGFHFNSERHRWVGRRSEVLLMDLLANSVQDSAVFLVFASIGLNQFVDPLAAQWLHKKRLSIVQLALN